MRPRRIAPILALLLLIISALPALASGSAPPISPRVLFNGTELQLPADQKALIIGGSTLVPVRAIFEALGGTVQWEESTQTVIGTKGAKVIKLPIGAPEATVDGKSVALSQPAQLIGGRTYIPLRFVREALGARVGWDGETMTVRITDKRPEVGGELTILVLRDLPSKPDQLSPLWAYGIDHFYAARAVFGDGLIRLGADDLYPEPALAKAFPQVGEDNRTYTFELRQGITFHDGHEVTATDFAYTFEVIMAEGYAGRYRGLGQMLESVRATDRYTVEMRSKEPNMHLLLTAGLIPPLPRHRLEQIPMHRLQDDPFWLSPVGAGPSS